jgi:hypothetical protein
MAAATVGANSFAQQKDCIFLNEIFTDIWSESFADGADKSAPTSL